VQKKKGGKGGKAIADAGVSWWEEKKRDGCSGRQYEKKGRCGAGLAR